MDVMNHTINYQGSNNVIKMFFIVLLAAYVLCNFFPNRKSTCALNCKPETSEIISDLRLTESFSEMKRRRKIISILYRMLAVHILNFS